MDVYWTLDDLSIQEIENYGKPKVLKVKKDFEVTEIKKVTEVIEVVKEMRIFIALWLSNLTSSQFAEIY